MPPIVVTPSMINAAIMQSQIAIQATQMRLREIREAPIRAAQLARAQDAAREAAKHAQAWSEPRNDVREAPAWALRAYAESRNRIVGSYGGAMWQGPAATNIRSHYSDTMETAAEIAAEVGRTGGYVNRYLAATATSKEIYTSAGVTIAEGYKGPINISAFSGRMSDFSTDAVNFARDTIARFESTNAIVQNYLTQQGGGTRIEIPTGTMVANRSPLSVFDPFINVMNPVATTIGSTMQSVSMFTRSAAVGAANFVFGGFRESGAGAIRQVVTPVYVDAKYYGEGGRANDIGLSAKFMGKNIVPLYSPEKGSVTERFAFDEYGKALHPGDAFEPAYGPEGIPHNPKMGNGNYEYIGEYQYSSGEIVSRYKEMDVGSYVDFGQGGMAFRKEVEIRGGASPGGYYETYGYSGSRAQASTSLTQQQRAVMLQSQTMGKGINLFDYAGGRDIPSTLSVQTTDHNEVDAFLESAYRRVSMGGDAFFGETLPEMAHGLSPYSRQGTAFSFALPQITAGVQAIQFGADALSGINKAGRISGIEQAKAGAMADYEKMYSDYSKSGLIVGSGENQKFVGSQEQFASLVSKSNQIEVMQREEDRYKSELVGGTSHADLWSMPIYEAFHGGADWWSKTVYGTNEEGKSQGWFKDVISPLNSDIAQQLGGTIEEYRAPVATALAIPTLGMSLGFARNNPIIPDTPSKLAEASSAIVGSPGQTAEFFGMVIPGTETILRGSPAMIPGLMAAGTYMQAQGVYEGMTTRPTGFFWEQVGMIATIEGAKGIVPLEYGSADLPTGSVKRVHVMRGMDLSFEEFNRYNMIFAKIPFTNVRLGGKSIFGRTGEGTRVGLQRAGFDVGDKVDYYRGPSKYFMGSPIAISERTKIEVKSPFSVDSQWSRAHYVIMNELIAAKAPRTEAQLWRMTGEATDTAHSMLYRATQREAMGEYPIRSASPETMAALYSLWGSYGSRVIVGGSRSVRAWEGAGARAESLADIDLWVEKSLSREVYEKSLEIVRKEHPDVENSHYTFINEGEGRFQITTGSDKFIGAHAIEEYSYVRRGIARMRSIGGDIWGPSPASSFEMKVSGMFSTIRYSPSEGVDFVVGRPKDIVDAYSLARGIAADFYTQSPRFDIGGVVTRMKISRGRTMETFSNVLRDYSENSIPRRQQREVGRMFGEIRTDLLEGVNRTPTPKFDIVTGHGMPYAYLYEKAGPLGIAAASALPLAFRVFGNVSVGSIEVPTGRYLGRAPQTNRYMIISSKLPWESWGAHGRATMTFASGADFGHGTRFLLGEQALHRAFSKTDIRLEIPVDEENILQRTAAMEVFTRAVVEATQRTNPEVTDLYMGYQRLHEVVTNPIQRFLFYRPTQVELAGELPTASVSRATMERVFQEMQRSGIKVTWAGSRMNIRPFTGEFSRGAEGFGGTMADFDFYLSEADMPRAYQIMLDAVSQEHPGAASDPHTELSRNARRENSLELHISTGHGKFLNAESFEFFSRVPHGWFNTMEVETVGGARVRVPSPSYALMAKISGAMRGAEITYSARDGLDIALHAGREKDWADLMGISRSMARDMYQPVRFDIGTYLQDAKIARAANAEAFSNTVMRFAQSRVPESRPFFSEMGQDFMPTVNRNPRPIYSITPRQAVVTAAIGAGVSWMVASGMLDLHAVFGPGTVAGIIFPGMKGGEHLLPGTAKLTEAELKLYRMQKEHAFQLEQSAITTREGKVLDYNVGDKRSVDPMSDEFFAKYEDAHAALTRTMKSSVAIHSHPTGATGEMLGKGWDLFTSVPSPADLRFYTKFSPDQGVIINRVGATVVDISPEIKRSSFKERAAAGRTMMDFASDSRSRSQALVAGAVEDMGIVPPDFMTQSWIRSLPKAQRFEVARAQGAALMAEFANTAAMWDIGVTFVRDIDINTGIGKTYGFSNIARSRAADLFRLKTESPIPRNAYGKRLVSPTGEILTRQVMEEQRVASKSEILQQISPTHQALEWRDMANIDWVDQFYHEALEPTGSRTFDMASVSAQDIAPSVRIQAPTPAGDIVPWDKTAEKRVFLEKEPFAPASFEDIRQQIRSAQRPLTQAEMDKEWVKSFYSKGKKEIGRFEMLDPFDSGRKGKSGKVFVPWENRAVEYPLDAVPSFRRWNTYYPKMGVLAAGERILYPPNQSARERYPLSIPSAAYPTLTHGLSYVMRAMFPSTVGYPTSNSSSINQGKYPYPSYRGEKERYPVATHYQPFVNYPSTRRLPSMYYPKAVTSNPYPKTLPEVYPRTPMQWVGRTPPNYPPQHPWTTSTIHSSTFTITTPITWTNRTTRKRKRRNRKSEEWYIWNPVPLFESVYGYNVREVWPGQFPLMSAKLKFPRPPKGPKFVPAYLTTKPPF